MSPAIRIEHLSKSYAAVRALDDLSFAIEPGCIFGLLGRNGAGKTTTFSCALGLTRPDSGTVAFFGRPLSPDALHRIAYVPETPALDGWMSGEQHLEYHRRIYRNFEMARARELADRFDLPLRRRVQRLSNGQKSALAIVLAFAQRADVLLLDEPTSGLDPHLQRTVLELVIQAGVDGCAVAISSHQIGHLERAAEKVAILDHGRIAMQGEVDELRSRHRQSLEDIFLAAGGGVRDVV